MKNIISLDSQININSALITSKDIILVYKGKEPIGYVYIDFSGVFTLHVSDFSEEDLMESEFPISTKDLNELMDQHPEYIFKLVE